MSPARTKSPALDAACASAVGIARAAAEEVARPGQVGEHLGASADADRMATHLFTCLDPAYRGWRWAVTVVRAARARNVTVDESVLLPGPDALLAPGWLPWNERLRPGDLGVGDLLPTPESDDRLVPGFTEALEETDQQAVWELGLGRARVLSPEGRGEAAERWHAGENGPDAALAKAAPDQCSTCGFFVPLAGSLRQAFGVCANELAPDDGMVVSVDHGCGAHSEATVEQSTSEPAPPIVDELGYDVVEHSPGSVDDSTSEPLGHS